VEKQEEARRARGDEEEEKEKEAARGRRGEKTNDEGKLLASRRTNKHELRKPIAQHCRMGKKKREKLQN
jgi:hypothetical protein